MGDLIVGGLAIASDVVGLILGLARMGDRPEVRQAQRQGFSGAVIGFVVFFAAIGLLIHLGIYGSRRGAFVVTLILSLCGLVAVFSGRMNLYSIAVNILIAGYAALRLGRAFGPPLR